MNRNWVAPLTGAAFVVVAIVGAVLMGEPPEADNPADEIVDHYVDNKDSIEIGAFLGALAGTLLIFFFGYLRSVLRAASGDGGFLYALPLIGAAIIALGIAIDSTISFAIAEAAEDIEPEQVQTLQALWDNDFLPFILGSQVLWFSTGIAVVKSGALPKWLGWIAIVFGVAALTPAGFFAFLAGGIWILIVSIMLATRGRDETPASAV
ncbi:MAG: hypothetical protein ACRDK5_11665 [Solirubrobacterales bacterium]